MKMIKKWFLGYLFPTAGGAGLLTALLAAASASGATAPTNVITSASDVVDLLCGILTWMFWGLIVLAIAMFLVGGYFYATSAGDAEKVKRATNTLTYAAIAVVVALVAQGIPFLIGSFVGAPTGQLNVCR